MDGSVRWTEQPTRPATHPGTAMERERLVARIAELAADGRSGEEIGKLLGESPRRIVRLARQSNIQLAGRGGMRHVTVEVPVRYMKVVDLLAEEAGVTRAVMLARLAIASLDGGAAGARRLLGKGAKPKRKYVMRQPRGPRGAYR